MSAAPRGGFQVATRPKTSVGWRVLHTMKSMAARFVLAIVVGSMLTGCLTSYNGSGQSPGSVVADNAMHLQASGAVRGNFSGRLSPTQYSICDLDVDVGAFSFFKIRGYFDKDPGYVEISVRAYHGAGTYDLGGDSGNAVEAGLHQPNFFRDGTSSLRWKSTDGEVTIVSGPDRFSQEGTAQGSLTARLVALADNPLGDRGEVRLEGTWSCDGRRVRDTLGN
jgi:hypothetical protein